MSNNPYSDNLSLRISDKLKVVADLLRAEGGEIPPALDRFGDTQGRYAAKIGAYETQILTVRQKGSIRRSQRALLVKPLQAAWDLVRTAGAATERKPAVQVEQERQLLFPYGRPTASSPADHDLVWGTDTLVSLLTDDSALARAWSPENLHAILVGRDAFVPAYQDWTQAVALRATLLTELELLRAEWYEDLVTLGNAVQRTMRRKGLPNRYAQYFRYRKPSKAKEAEEAPPEPGDPPPADPGTE